jgi:hypothetical protein
LARGLGFRVRVACGLSRRIGRALRRLCFPVNVADGAFVLSCALLRLLDRPAKRVNLVVDRFDVVPDKILRRARRRTGDNENRNRNRG